MSGALRFPEHDLVLPRRRYGEPLVRALPAAQVVELRDVGHSPVHDDPELVARTIRDFAETAAPLGATSQPAGSTTTGP